MILQSSGISVPGVYPNLPLGGLNSNDLRSGGLDEDLFNQLRAKQLQSQLMQTQQAAAMMGASGKSWAHVSCLIMSAA